MLKNIHQFLESKIQASKTQTSKSQRALRSIARIEQTLQQNVNKDNPTAKQFANAARAISLPEFIDGVNTLLQQDEIRAANYDTQSICEIMSMVMPEASRVFYNMTTDDYAILADYALAALETALVYCNVSFPQTAVLQNMLQNCTRPSVTCQTCQTCPTCSTCQCAPCQPGQVCPTCPTCPTCPECPEQDDCQTCPKCNSATGPMLASGAGGFMAGMGVMFMLMKK